MDEKVQIYKLSKDFVLHCRKDSAKKCILFSKLILQSLNVWPDNKHWMKRWLVIVVIFNQLIMGLAHLAYTIINLTNVTKMTSAATTVLVVFETIAKLSTMLYYRDPLNKILYSIWKDFWPSEMVSEEKRRGIKFCSSYVITVGVSFLCMAFFSNAQFMMFPLLAKVDELPLASRYPFNFRESPQYELLYIWQWFMNQVIITTLTGFDSFFNALVMICAVQFRIIQEVLEKLINTPMGMLQVIFKKEYKEGLNEMDVLIKCVKQHMLLLEICETLENIFSHIIFIQFVISTAAMCVPCIALFSDPDVWEHMLSYFIAHVFQFFIYCSVGNELTYQSGMLAEAAYHCEWNLSRNSNFRKGLVMIIQRSQRPTSLTVAGLMQLSFANFIATVQLSFSFYTLLSSFV